MSDRWNSTAPVTWIDADSTSRDVHEVVEFLTSKGTFYFPVLPNGLFSAAAGDGGDFELTGYRNVWLRDNIQIAWAHWAVQGNAAVAVRCVSSLMEFYGRHRHRFTSVINGDADASEPMNRPHIRFNGTDLAELPEKWSHAQNDALGYLLWLTCRLIASGDLPCSFGAPDQSPTISTSASPWDLLSLLVHYWQTVEVWRDEDSGHWEEVRKIAASSIGCATAGLTELRALMQRPEIADALRNCEYSVRPEMVDDLISLNRSAMSQILPAECVQADPSKNRRYDSALLFLIYPLNIVGDRELEDRILADVAQHLAGPIGIRRYLGDSYWCADYRDLLSAEQRTADFSDSLDARDRLLKPGMEAQWCIFDPIVSCIHGQRFLQSGDPASLALQRASLVRSLAQLSPRGGRFPEYRCPESWFCEKGVWQPNDITPLLWTQGNLWQALTLYRRSLDKLGR